MPKMVDDNGATWWEPDTGKPGSYVVESGRKWQVWSAGPERGSLWLVPCHPRAGEAPVFLSHRGTVTPHHGDGTECLKRCRRKHKRATSVAA